MTVRRWARTTHLVLLAAVVLAGSKTVHAQQVERGVRAAVDRYVEAVNAGQPRAVAALYANDPVTATIGDGEIFRGPLLIGGLLSEIYATSAPIRMLRDTVTVFVLGDSAAIAYFNVRWTAGDPPVSSVGAMTMIFRLTSNGWRVAHDHTSTLPAGAVGGSTYLGGPDSPVRQTRPCAITRVMDGDTIECAGIGRVRLIGIDTPERDQEPFGRMATEVLGQILRSAGSIVIERDVELEDRYGRTLGHVWADGRLVNWMMVRGGWAVLLTYPPNVQYVDALRTAEGEAREQRAGLWAIEGFACRPVDHRAERC